MFDLETMLLNSGATVTVTRHPHNYTEVKVEWESTKKPIVVSVGGTFAYSDARKQAINEAIMQKLIADSIFVASLPLFGDPVNVDEATVEHMRKLQKEAPHPVIILERTKDGSWARFEQSPGSHPESGTRTEQEMGQADHSAASHAVPQADGNNLQRSPESGDATGTGT